MALRPFLLQVTCSSGHSANIHHVPNQGQALGRFWVTESRQGMQPLLSQRSAYISVAKPGVTG